MTRNSSIRLIATTPLIAVLAACGGGAGGEAAADAPPEIAERQENFEAIGDAMKGIGQELETGNPDLVFIGEQATDMNARAKKVAGLFPEGSSVEDGFDTEALPAIWEKPAEFKKAHQNFVAASSTMITLAEEGDAAAVGAHMKELGGTCKACHDNFRVDDD